VARFIRDEKRTYPLTWMAIGGIFAGSAAWAIYAELVTRVPWQKQQQAFFEMELQQSKQALDRSGVRWTKEVEPSLKAKLDRKAELEKSQASGDYAAAKARLDQLNVDFANAEMGKTFGSSDLDEAYYHREEAEYERDKIATEVRALLHEYYAGSDHPHEGDKRGDAIYADPPLPKQAEGVTDKMFHLQSEIARMEVHIKNIEAAIADSPNRPIREALEASRKAETEVVEDLKVEEKHQVRVDAAVAAMAKIDGPADPALAEKDPQKREEERKRERLKACQGREDTRTCINWLKLEPVDLEIKSLDVDVSKSKRFLVDAQLRNDKAEAKAHPKFDAGDVIHSLVGPYQIQQVVFGWMDAERDVDREQVDRCTTCHMGAAAAGYTDASIPRQFRTHPYRSTLMAAHPVETFGCTSCHQGQGRATDKLAHSGWHLETEHDGDERWHFAGDHYWEDPLLPIGGLHKIIVDDENDELSVRINRGQWTKVSIPQRNPEIHDKTACPTACGPREVCAVAPGRDKRECLQPVACKSDKDCSGDARCDAQMGCILEQDKVVPASYQVEGEQAEGTRLTDEDVFFGALQGKIQAVVKDDAAVAAKWHAVVRKLDNRVQIGLEQNDPNELLSAKETPVFNVRFTKPELGETLGFVGVSETAGKQALLSASGPPAVPVRGDGEGHLDKKSGRFVPPRGSEGLQIPDDMRNRFIQSLPEMEASCLRCHTGDVDLKPRTSKAKFVAAKLEREKAEAFLAKDPSGYKKAHEGSSDLPAVLPDPADASDPVPTFTEGRHLFRKLNCTGCHILDGYPWDRNSGPGLDNVTAKVSPEWVLTWIRYPRGWRAKTRMPNLWPKPLDPASKRPIPASSPEYDKWKQTMRDETVAIASFLVERSDNPATRPGAPKDAQPLKARVQGYADVPGATAEKGKVFFESYGCQGCHATSDAELPEPWKGRERDVAPTLANMAGKTTADWIAYWVESPSRYWHGTKMPNLRLSRLEAASVGKYVSSLSSKPLAPADVEKADVALVSDPAKRNERVPCANAGGQVMSRAECGEKLVGYYGCFGCHSITGFEKSSPIAPELGSFAKKDISTLDFGYAIPDHHLQTTETFATLKLDSPRIYRRDRIELKMGDFDLSPREIRALVTFLKGLTSGKPRNAYAPNQHPEFNAALEGRQIVDDYNCRGCHLIEEHGADIDAVRAAVLNVDAQARAPFLGGEGMRVQPEWLFAFLREPGKNGIRPWLHPEWAYGAEPGSVPADKLALRMPTFNFSEEQVTAIVRYFASWDGQEYPYEAARARELSQADKTYALAHMISADDANCLSCHYQGEFPVDRGLSELGKLAPNLNNVARRLRPEWVKAWLLRPQNWLPYTKMTAFWATAERPKDAQFWPGPADQDPFISKVPDWKLAPGPDNVTSEMQAEMIRDFLFGLTPDAKFPASVADVPDSPLVKGHLVEQPKPEAANDKDGKDKDKKTKDKDKGKDKNKRKTGAIQGPARL
jgi:cytochrome c551/c552